MSRQYDEYMEGHFDFHGEDLCVVYPTNAAELAQAYDVRSKIETLISELLHDEDSSNLEQLLKEQEGAISEYVDSLGDFDNSILASNIEYFCKQVGMKVSGLEGTLSISPGYISRTIGENSKKKMSIDTVWKISKLFDVGIDTLIDRKVDSQQLNANESLIMNVINKLISDSEEGKITWEKETPREMEENSGEYGTASNLFMDEKEYYDLGFSGYPEKTGERMEFKSRFFADDYQINLLGNCYHSLLPKTSTTVYLVHLSHANQGFVDDIQYELYTHSAINNKITPVCGSLFVKEEIAKALEKLYTIVDSTNATISIPSDLKDTLQTYLDF